MLQNDLLKRIERECDRRSESIIDRYVAKRGEDWLEDVLTSSEDRIEFEKDIMVCVDGEWYRCHCCLGYGKRYYCDAGDYNTPPYEYDEDVYDCYVRSVVNERTKEVLKGASCNKKAA